MTRNRETQTYTETQRQTQRDRQGLKKKGRKKGRQRDQDRPGPRAVPGQRRSPGHLGPPSLTRGLSLNLGCPRLTRWERKFCVSSPYPPPRPTAGPTALAAEGRVWTHTVALTYLTKSREAQGRLGPIGGAGGIPPDSLEAARPPGGVAPTAPAVLSQRRIQFLLICGATCKRSSVLLDLAI